ncbi:TonB-dependent receptor domain-containing protein, partial [Roseateles sp. GG27B]
FQATPKLSLSLDGYYREISHLQDEGQFGNALIYSAYNYAKGRIYGLDFAANFRDRSFSSYLNIGFTHARGTQIETGQFNFGASELAFIADHWVHLDHEQSLSASAGAALRLDNGVSLSADALYGSGLRNGYANTDHLPAYLTVNAAVSKSFNGSEGLGKWDARLSVVNLFDHSYALRDGSGIGVGAPQFGLRRTLYASLSKPF